MIVWCAQIQTKFVMLKIEVCPMTSTRRPKQNYERGPSVPPLEPPTLSTLKAREHLSSSAESLLGEVDSATGLSTPALHKATTRGKHKQTAIENMDNVLYVVIHCDFIGPLLLYCLCRQVCPQAVSCGRGYSNE